MAYRRLNNGYGGTLVKNAVAKLHAAQSELNQAKAMAAAVLAMAGGSDNLEEPNGVEFGAMSGQGQAVHDEIGTMSDNLDTFMSTNATVLGRYNPGS